jgi:hypothetical protein
MQDFRRLQNVIAKLLTVRPKEPKSNVKADQEMAEQSR